MKKTILVLGLLAGLGLVIGACDDDDGGGGGGSAKICTEKCAAAADCVTAGTTADQWECTGGTCKPNLCSTDDDCTAMMSGWTTACTDGGGECMAGYVCVNVGGGLCAFEETDMVKCDTMSMSAMDKPLIDGSGDATVCGNDSYTCQDGMCQAAPCTSDDDCTTTGFEVCKDGACVQCKTDADCTGTMTACSAAGYCGCKDDSECSGSTPKCNTSLNFCGCGSDADCSGMTNADTCYSGVCGCAGDATCSGATSGASTTWSCE